MSDLNENQTNEQVQTAEVSQSNSAESASASPDQASFAGAELVGGVEPAKKKPVFLIIAIIVVILAAGSAAAYNFIPWVKNNVKMLLNSPEDYYAWVEQENIENAADKFSEAYGKMLGSSATSEEFEFKADLDSANVGALIEELTGSPLSESGIVLPSSVAIKSGADIDENGNIKSSLVFNSDDKTLATMNLYMMDGVYYYQIPELSPSYISMDLDTVMEEMYSDMGVEEAAFIESYMDALISISTDPESLKEMLSEKELNELMVKYFTIVFENIDDVELDKSIECEVNGVETTYNKLEANIDQGTVFSIVKDVLKEAKKDKTLIKLVEKFGLTEDDYTAAVDSLLSQIGTVSVSGGDTVLKMYVYVDSNGKICGREFVVPDEENIDIGYMTAKDGSDSSFDIKLLANDEGFQIVGNCEEKSGKESGSAKVMFAGSGDNIEFAINYSDLETINEDKGYLKGDVSVDLTSLNGPVITVNLDSDGKSQTIKSDITVDGKNYGTLSLTSKEELTVDIPEFDSSQQVYQYSEDGAQLEQYISNADLETFINNIGSAFGVDGLGALMSAAMSDQSGDVTGGYTGSGITDGSAGDITSGSTTGVSGDVTYDFSKLDIKVNGQSVKLPAKIDGLIDQVTIDKEKVEAGYLESFYNDDYSFGLTVANESDTDAAPKDCLISGIDVSEGSPVSVTIDGFAVGGNVADLANKYGVKLQDANNGYFTIYDISSEWNEMVVYYYDGKIYEINIEFMEF